MYVSSLDLQQVYLQCLVKVRPTKSQKELGSEATKEKPRYWENVNLECLASKLVKLKQFNTAYASECKCSNDVILYLITNNLLTIQNKLSNALCFRQSNR